MTLPWEFLVEADPVAKRMALHIQRSGAAGIHRSALYQRAQLRRLRLRTLPVRMGYRDRQMPLSRSAVVNNALRSYFVDPDFAAGVTRRALDDLGRPGEFPSSGGRGR